MTDAAMQILDDCEHKTCDNLAAIIRESPGVKGVVQRVPDSTHIDDVATPLGHHPELRLKVRVLGLTLYLRAMPGGLIPHWMSNPDHGGQGVDTISLVDSLRFGDDFAGVCIMDVMTVLEVPESAREMEAGQ